MQNNLFFISAPSPPQPDPPPREAAPKPAPVFAAKPELRFRRRGRAAMRGSRREGAALRGISAAEVVVATLVLALALIPMLGVFFQSREVTYKSKLAYLALHVARERMEELRQIPFNALDACDTGDTWVSTAGSAFAHTKQHRNDPIDSSYGGLSKADFAYPAEYGRIHTRVRVAPLARRNYGVDAHADDTTSLQAQVKPVRMKAVTIEYYWQEKGESPDEARRKNFATLSTIVGSHNAQ